jgi:uncharacterized protein with ATP-grasp and redox domains
MNQLKEKYNKEQYNLWLKYQEKQTCEDYIKEYQEEKESQKSKSLQALNNIRNENRESEDNLSLPPNTKVRQVNF